MLKIKLQRVGKKNQPSYRIVIAEAKSKLSGKYVDLLGTYDPKTNPSSFKVDKEKYKSWLKKGAQPTKTIRLLTKKL